VVGTVGRETIRGLFVSHALKPWREKTVVRAAARPGIPAGDGGGAGLNRPLNNHVPVVALDERPVQLVDSLRPATAMAPGRPARRDYEYARCGMAKVFCVVEPKPVAIRPTPRKIVPRPNLPEPLIGARAVIPRRAPFIWSWIISTPIGKNPRPPPSVLNMGTSYGSDSRTKLKIDWRFSTADARRVFHYQRIATHDSKH